MERFTVLFATASEFLKNLRTNKFKTNRVLDGQLDIFRDLLERVIDSSIEIVPVALKLIIMEEKRFNSTAITNRLLRDPKRAKRIAKILQG